MLRVRVIPCLLLHDSGLVKTIRFRKPVYLGDPINAVRIFNEKEVDELIFLDIGATRGSGPDFDLLEDIASEAFMPFGYGGGVNDVDQIRRLFALGVEKVVINTAAYTRPGLIEDAVNLAGSSSIVASIDVLRGWRGRYSVRISGGKKRIPVDPVTYAKELERMGVGEIVLNAIHQDGTMQGYDLDLIGKVSCEVSVPVVALGGAGCLNDFKEAVRYGASAVGAGSYFVFHGRHRALLITYPPYDELEELLGRTGSRDSAPIETFSPMRSPE